MADPSLDVPGITNVNVFAPQGNMSSNLFTTPSSLDTSLNQGIGNITTVDTSTITNDAASSIGPIASGAGGGNAIGGGVNFGQLGTAVSDIFGAMGDEAEAKDYRTAEGIANQNVALASESTALQQTQAARQVYQTIGTQKAQVAGAGFQEGGSSQDLLRSSQQQGELSKQVIGVQGLVNENGYKQQAAAYGAQASAANAAANAGFAGGLINGVGALAGLF